MCRPAAASSGVSRETPSSDPERSVSRETPTPGTVSRETPRVVQTLREAALLPIHLWRLVSRLLPPRCRYHPSCSRYAIDAIRRHGIVAGTVLSAWRLLRCNPWSLGGIDEVPQSLHWREKLPARRRGGR